MPFNNDTEIVQEVKKPRETEIGEGNLARIFEITDNHSTICVIKRAKLKLFAPEQLKCEKEIYKYIWEKIKTDDLLCIT